jgi:hypothetical protein
VKFNGYGEYVADLYKDGEDRAALGVDAPTTDLSAHVITPGAPAHLTLSRPAEGCADGGQGMGTRDTRWRQARFDGRRQFYPPP